MSNKLQERRKKAMQLMDNESDSLSDIDITSDDENLTTSKVKHELDELFESESEEKKKKKKKKYNEKFYEKNKSKISDQNKRKITCKICGVKINKGSLNLHKKSISHRINKLTKLMYKINDKLDD